MEYNFEDLNMKQMKVLLERYNGQQKSKAKYYAKNKNIIDTYNKNYIKERYKNDPEFREKQKAYAKQRRLKLKELDILKQKIDSMQNDKYENEFGELNIIVE